jgi:hypothetical protein
MFEANLELLDRTVGAVMIASAVVVLCTARPAH